jgi:hypothetical protein
MKNISISSKIIEHVGPFTYETFEFHQPSFIDNLNAKENILILIIVHNWQIKVTTNEWERKSVGVKSFSHRRRKPKSGCKLDNTQTSNAMKSYNYKGMKKECKEGTIETWKNEMVASRTDTYNISISKQHFKKNPKYRKQNHS